jgi:hypothetical protein
MRFIAHITLDTQRANQAARAGFQAIPEILAQQKPEAAYFAPLHGRRTRILILNLTDASQVGAIAEPWYLAFDAEVNIAPAMVADDLAKAGPVIGAAVEKYLA